MMLHGQLLISLVIITKEQLMSDDIPSKISLFKVVLGSSEGFSGQPHHSSLSLSLIHQDSFSLILIHQGT